MQNVENYLLEPLFACLFWSKLVNFLHILSGVQAALKIRILKGNHLAPFQDHLKGQLTAPRPLHVKQQKKKKKKKSTF